MVGVDPSPLLKVNNRVLSSLSRHFTGVCISQLYIHTLLEWWTLDPYDWVLVRLGTIAPKVAVSRWVLCSVRILGMLIFFFKKNKKFDIRLKNRLIQGYVYILIVGVEQVSWFRCLKDVHSQMILVESSSMMILLMSHAIR